MVTVAQVVERDNSKIIKLSKILLTTMIGTGVCTSCEPKKEKTMPNQPKIVVKDTIMKKIPK